MRVPIVGQMDANSAEIRPFPALDAAARVTLTANDGQPAIFQADSVECRDFLAGGRSDICFWLDGIPAKSWSAVVTDQRFIVHNTYSKGLIGKPKEKPGKATAGHLYFGSISNLSAFLNNGTPVLLVCCIRQDGTRTAITLKSSDIESMKRLAYELHDRIDKWIVAQGRKFDEASADEKRLSVLQKWNKFNSSVWTGDKEYSVFVPCNSWDQVADSRLS